MFCHNIIIQCCKYLLYVWSNLEHVNFGLNLYVLFYKMEVLIKAALWYSELGGAVVNRYWTFEKGGANAAPNRSRRKSSRKIEEESSEPRCWRASPAPQRKAGRTAPVRRPRLPSSRSPHRYVRALSISLTLFIRCCTCYFWPDRLQLLLFLTLAGTSTSSSLFLCLPACAGEIAGDR
jgi:hypothetical protein